jgi:excisionase family DNA binding protein
MVTRPPFKKFDAYMAALVDDALQKARTKSERRKVLEQASQVTRRMSRGVAQRQVLAAIERGEGPKSLPELQQVMTASRARWPNAARLSPRVAMRTERHSPRSTEPLLTPGEVARELGVSAKTVANWCKQGLLRCEVLDSGHRRIPASALEAYRAGQTRWRRVDDLVRSARGAAPAPDEAAIFEELAARRQR